MRAWQAHPHVSQVLALRPEWPIHGLPVCVVHYCPANRLNEIGKINQRDQTGRSFPIAPPVCTYAKNALLPGLELVPL